MVVGCNQRDDLSVANLEWFRVLYWGKRAGERPSASSRFESAWQKRGDLGFASGSPPGEKVRLQKWAWLVISQCHQKRDQGGRTPGAAGSAKPTHV
ncbi:hypothetical protein MAMC_01662 [Methylacidimicrobium cyclopophantes]|uniref:Uncharacterized protein n=1 Tax=Methylacidimicrobium cyclopophantes TaxID=1041766 RepID=A0A5E6MEH9_9BACT|nr:hypothetical protein MAMC_01662 [Methylacidimicrobium cyclopophantes]